MHFSTIFILFKKVKSFSLLFSMKLYKMKFINKMTSQKKRLTGSLTKHKAFCIPFGQVLDRPFQKVPFFSFFKT